MRPQTLGFTSLLTLLAALHAAHAADATCRQACHDQIAACVAAGGRLRACRRRVLGRCRREGVAVCQGGTTADPPTTTTITLGPTTTTTRPPTITRPTPTGAGGPGTGLHYAPNGNFDSSGNYAPGTAGFNLAD